MRYADIQANAPALSFWESVKIENFGSQVFLARTFDFLSLRNWLISTAPSVLSFRARARALARAWTDMFSRSSLKFFATFRSTKSGS